MYRYFLYKAKNNFLFGLYLLKNWRVINHYYDCYVSRAICFLCYHTACNIMCFARLLNDSLFKIYNYLPAFLDVEFFLYRELAIACSGV